jgi:3-hydroxyacyl-[acyl-carrier-protein] dehydratase
MAFAFLDRILECDAGERVVARKALSLNEEFFQDHFPGMPVLPGAMILEGFVQAVRHCLSEAPDGHARWTLDSVATMRFNRFARPGELLELEATRDREEEGAILFKGRATVDGEGVCRLKFAVREAPASG